MIRVQVEVPAEGADADVIAALRAVGKTLQAPVEFAKTAPANSYSLTIHVLADKEE